MQMRQLLFCSIMFSFSCNLLGQIYTCPRGDIVGVEQINTVGAGPGCLVDVVMEITPDNAGNWKWELGASAGTLWVPPGVGTSKHTIGSIYLPANCNNLSAYFLYLQPPGGPNSTCDPIPLGVLPIELIDFEVISISEKSIEANWKIEGFMEGDMVILQNSGDAMEWKNVEAVSLIQGQDEYSLNYELNNFSDEQYFRLQINGIDGSIYYSANRVVKGQREKPAFVFPNPIQKGQPLNFSGGKSFDKISMYSQLGKKVIVRKINGKSFIIPENIPSGIYIIRNEGLQPFNALLQVIN